MFSQRELATYVLFLHPIFILISEYLDKWSFYLLITLFMIKNVLKKVNNHE